MSTPTLPSPPSALPDAAAVRFWDDVLVGAPDDCWPWIGRRGTRERSGHVRLWHQGKKVFAHRIAFYYAGGDLHEGEVVRHSVCDRPDCQNYLHMRAGTSAENTRERDERNRRTPYLPHGEAHWSAKLTNADAERIRRARLLRVSAQDVATMYGVSKSSIYNIWGGTHYAPAA